ncbi:MAG: transposase [Oscillospiraceae bacterium]|nr:transposase [Oscillospiraceae bacterium]
METENYTFISAILFMAENGCKWRSLPREFGNWNSIYKRFER